MSIVYVRVIVLETSVEGLLFKVDLNSTGFTWQILSDFV